MKNTQPTFLKLTAIIFACGVFPAAIIGLIESAWLLPQNQFLGLDLATLPFAATASGLLGGLLALFVALGMKLFSFYFGKSSSSRLALLPAAVAIVWLGLTIATDWVRVVYMLPLTSPEGVSVFGVVGALVVVLLFALPKLSAVIRRTIAFGSCCPSSLKGAALCFIPMVLSWTLPFLLDALFFHSDGIPALRARQALLNGPEIAEPVAERGPASIENPDVVVITLDTTRADHLSVYGYGRDTSPHLEEFAKEAVRFDNAWSASSWTVPSHASLFTGLFPHSHGARYKTYEEHQAEADVTSAQHKTWIRPLDPAQQTLAEVLQKHGYRTGGFAAGPYMYATFGMAQGFEYYDDRMHKSVAPLLTSYYLLNRFVVELEPDLLRFGWGYLRADEVNQNVFTWMDTLHHDRMFLFVNYFDAHEPYWPVAETRDRYPKPDLEIEEAALTAKYRKIIQGKEELSAEEELWLKSQYDAEIRFMDSHLGELFQRLKDEGRWDNAMIVVTADHGEHLGEHGLVGHGFSVYAPSTHIPLLVKWPKSDEIAPQERDYPVHLVDIAPTIMSRLGLDLVAEFGHPTQGRHLLDQTKPHTTLSEVYRDDWRVTRFGDRYSRNMFAWTTQEARLVEIQQLDEKAMPSSPPTYKLYSNSKDRLDLTPLSDEAAIDRLIRAWRGWREGAIPFVPSSYLSNFDASAAESALGATGYAD